MDTYKTQLLAKTDQLAQEADQLEDGDPRRADLIKQIEALNVAITLYAGD